MQSQSATRTFEFLREIASGGFGSVFLAKVVHADGFSRLAAVKLLHRRWSENQEVSQRMRDEARLLGWLRHRNIVDVVDLTTIDGRTAIVMEYLEAVNLKTLTVGTADQGTLIPPRCVLEIASYVGSALDAAYNRPPFPGEKALRVIHRDIKPSNIMVDETGHVKVLDFGVARADFDSRESETRELQFGSINYMPPERLFFEPETPASDIYSLGSTLFEVFTQERLGKAKNSINKHRNFIQQRMEFLASILQADEASTARICDLLARCLDFNAESRISAAELIQECRSLMRSLPPPGLGEWAELVVPQLLAQNQAQGRESHPLVNQVHSEDSHSRPVVQSADSAAGPVRRRERPPEVALPTSEQLPVSRWGEQTLVPQLSEALDGVLEEEASLSQDWDDGPTRIDSPMVTMGELMGEPEASAPVPREPIGEMDTRIFNTQDDDLAAELQADEDEDFEDDVDMMRTELAWKGDNQEARELLDELNQEDQRRTQLQEHISPFSTKQDSLLDLDAPSTPSPAPAPEESSTPPSPPDDWDAPASSPGPPPFAPAAETEGPPTYSPPGESDAQRGGPQPRRRSDAPRPKPKGKSSSSKLWVTLALAPLLIAVAYWLFRTKVQDPTQLPELPPVEAAADAEQEATEPSSAEPAAELAAEEGDEAAAQEDSGQEQPVQLEFISAAPSTKKIVVKCGSETQRSQDGAPVTLPWADSAVQCRVTAMTEGGRKVAFFEVEQPGVYRCFEEDKAECRRLP